MARIAICSTDLKTGLTVVEGMIVVVRRHDSTHNNKLIVYQYKLQLSRRSARLGAYKMLLRKRRTHYGAAIERPMFSAKR